MARSIAPKHETTRSRPPSPAATCRRPRDGRRSRAAPSSTEFSLIRSWGSRAASSRAAVGC